MSNGGCPSLELTQEQTQERIYKFLCGELTDGIARKRKIIEATNEEEAAKRYAARKWWKSLPSWITLLVWVKNEETNDDAHIFEVTVTSSPICAAVDKTI